MRVRILVITAAIGAMTGHFISSPFAMVISPLERGGKP
jgi:hypothetical protein